MNTQDVFERAKKSVETIHSTIQTLEIQREEVQSFTPLCLSYLVIFPNSHQDVKTVQHMEQVNLKKYRVTSVKEAFAVLEEGGDSSVCWYYVFSPLV